VSETCDVQVRSWKPKSTQNWVIGTVRIRKISSIWFRSLPSDICFQRWCRM